MSRPKDKPKRGVPPIGPARDGYIRGRTIGGRVFKERATDSVLCKKNRARK